MGRRVLKFDGLSGRGLWWRLRRRLQKRGRGWRRRLCRRVASLRSGGNSGFAAEGGGSALRAQIIKKPAPIPVISTAAGQPPIGKPLIVQARGQLRLTWRLYAESPQSGEISPPLMVRAALRQEIFRLRVSSERFASTPIPAHPPARDDGAGGQHWTHLRR